MQKLCEQNKECEWICPNCGLPNLSDSFFDDSISAHQNLYDSLNVTCSSSDDGNLSKDSSIDGNYDQRTTSRQNHKRPLRVLTMNCRSVKSLRKRSQLYAILETEKPDILFATESHIDSNTTDAEIFPPDMPYKIIRHDRNSYGGGVFIAHRDDLIVSKIYDLGIESEAVFANVHMVGCPVLYLGCFYRPTDNNSEPLVHLHEDLSKLLDKDTMPQLLLAGD